MHDVTDMRWIPVVGLDGRREKVGLREVFLRAGEISEFGDMSAIERSALTRLLTGFTALVVREGKTTDRLDLDAIETVLGRYAPFLRLDDPDRPFLQEWGVTTEGVGNPLESIAPGAPGASSKAWRVRSRSTSHWADQMGVESAALYLAVRWYHGFGGNAKSLHDVSAGNGTVGGRPGDDLAFFWRGTTLERTLLANTPQSWVRGKGLPGFLDRGATTHGPAASPHPLWVNHANFLGTLLTWEDGEITGVRTSGTLHTAPGYASTDATASKKNYLDMLRGMDESRVWIEVKGKRVLFTKIRPSSAALVNLREWYQGLGSRALSASRVRADGVLPADVGDEQWTLEMFAAAAPGTTSVSYKAADWFSYDPRSLDFDDEQAEALLVSSGRILDALKSVTGVIGSIFEGDKSTQRWAVMRSVEQQFYRLAGVDLASVLVSSSKGRALDDELASSITRLAYEALVTCTEPLMTTNAAVKVVIARSRAQRALYTHTAKIAAPLKETA